VHYLAPQERSGHDISLAVDIDAGVAIEEIVCRSHVVEIEGWTAEGAANGSESASFARVRLSDMDSIPNKDFVLRWKVAGDEVKTAMLTHTDERGGFFTLMVVPPEEIASLSRRPLEMVFVIDCSGSMSGEPIAQAKGAVKRALRRLRQGDSFQVIRFSQSASQFGAAPVEATAANVERAVRWVDRLDGGGGTMMIEGIKAALDFPHDPERLRFVTFLTDGYIGNEAEILAAVHDKLGASRIFSFGVGSSPNRYLMDAMAKMGRGAVAYLGLHDSATDVMDGFMDRVSHAALTDIEIDFGGLQVSEVYPGGADGSADGRVPDLYVGRPVILSGRFEPASLDLVSHITLRGRAAGGNTPGDDGQRWVEWPVRVNGPAPVEFAGAAQSINAEPAFVPRIHALPAVWARQKIADLADRAVWMPEAQREAPEMIRNVALEYGLMSAFTAFVAVDSLSHTEGEYGTTVNVPVPVPEGVRYETTVPASGG
jgi:Ca-activated chloride channel family protein